MNGGARPCGAAGAPPSPAARHAAPLRPLPPAQRLIRTCAIPTQSTRELCAQRAWLRALPLAGQAPPAAPVAAAAALPSLTEPPREPLQPTAAIEAEDCTSVLAALYLREAPKRRRRPRPTAATGHDATLPPPLAPHLRRAQPTPPAPPARSPQASHGPTTPTCEAPAASALPPAALQQLGQLVAVWAVGAPPAAHPELPTPPLAAAAAAAPGGSAPAFGQTPAFDLRFTKHLAVVTNGTAQPSARLQSLGWLLFESKRLQSAAVGARAGEPGAWLALGAPGMLLLAQVLMVGQGVAEVGSMEQALPAGSNAARAVSLMDYGRLLRRYLHQHGALLDEAFVGQLPDDDLQATAIHVGALLETRRALHQLILERLMAGVGLEGAASARAGAGDAPAPAPPVVISNTNVLSSALECAPTMQQAAVASPQAHSASSAAAECAAPSPPPPSRGFGAVLVAAAASAGAAVRWVFVVFVFVKDVVVKLLMLRVAMSAVRAAQASAPRDTKEAPASRLESDDPWDGWGSTGATA